MNQTEEYELSFYCVVNKVLKVEVSDTTGDE